MKLIIDIDESLLDGIKSDNFDFARQVVRSFQGTIASSIANGTPIPDNATNGDVIKAMFPNVKTELGVDKVIFARGLNNVTPFSEEWWNAKYQKGGK